MKHCSCSLATTSSTTRSATTPDPPNAFPRLIPARVSPTHASPARHQFGHHAATALPPQPYVGRSRGRAASAPPARRPKGSTLRQPIKKLPLRERWRLVHTAAASLGLELPGPTGGNLHQWRAQPSADEYRAAARLLADARSNADLAGTSDPAKLLAAFGYLRDFCMVTPNRYLFAFPRYRGDIIAEQYNESTFAMLAQFIRERGSREQGKLHGRQLRADTIAGHISVIKTFLERHVGCELIPPSRTARTLPRQLKQFRAEDGIVGIRKLRMGLRGKHLKALAELCAGNFPPTEFDRCAVPSHKLVARAPPTQPTVRTFDRRTYMGVLRWSILLGGHNLLMRGGEPGVPDGHTFSANMGNITIASLSFRPIEYKRLMRACAILLVKAIKDSNRRGQPVPMVVMQRNDPHDPVCTYGVLRQLWSYRASTVPRHLHNTVPLFALPARPGPHGGKPVEPPVTTAFVRETVRLACDLLGLAPGLYGSSSLRIGGATDLYDLLGVGGARLIRERGRWASDVAHIYQRCNATEHARISAGIVDANAMDLEAFTGSWWAQPG